MPNGEVTGARQKKRPLDTFSLDRRIYQVTVQYIWRSYFSVLFRGQSTQGLIRHHPGQSCVSFRVLCESGGRARWGRGLTLSNGKPDGPKIVRRVARWRIFREIGQSGYPRSISSVACGAVSHTGQPLHVSTVVCVCTLAQRFHHHHHRNRQRRTDSGHHVYNGADSPFYSPSKQSLLQVSKASSAHQGYS
jgi:hypothetical protein